MKPLNLAEEMLALSKQRPIFHSEADFQHELGMSLRSRHPALSLRLEHPRDDAPGAIDIVGRAAGKRALALELKYLCGSLITQLNDEKFVLRAQAGHPFRRYDVVKDLEAMEASARAHPGSQAAVIILSNDPSYWSRTKRNIVSDVHFRFDDGQTLAGARSWAEQASEKLRGRRPKELNLEGEYICAWEDFSSLSPPQRRGNFRFLVLEVAASGATSLVV